MNQYSQSRNLQTLVDKNYMYPIAQMKMRDGDEIAPFSFHVPAQGQNGVQIRTPEKFGVRLSKLRSFVKTSIRII